jgi:hypothetical protein
VSPMFPANGPPRLIRYVTPEVMPNSKTVSMLDEKNNLLFVQRELFDLLTPHEQRRVLATDQKYLEIKTY